MIIKNPPTHRNNQFTMLTGCFIDSEWTNCSILFFIELVFQINANSVSSDLRIEYFLIHVARCQYVLFFVIYGL